MIELGTERYGGPVEWDECDSLRDALRTARHLVDENLAYPYQIRVDGAVRWEYGPDKYLNFRWRRVEQPEAIS